MTEDQYRIILSKQIDQWNERNEKQEIFHGLKLVDQINKLTDLK